MFVATWVVERGQDASEVLEWGKGRGTPMAVEPSFMASREYSTWKRRPSGEKVLEKDCQSTGYVVSRYTHFMPRSIESGSACESVLKHVGELTIF